MPLIIAYSYAMISSISFRVIIAIEFIKISKPLPYPAAKIALRKQMFIAITICRTILILKRKVARCKYIICWQQSDVKEKAKRLIDMIQNHLLLLGIVDANNNPWKSKGHISSAHSLILQSHLIMQFPSLSLKPTVQVNSFLDLVLLHGSCSYPTVSFKLASFQNKTVPSKLSMIFWFYWLKKSLNLLMRSVSPFILS